MANNETQQNRGFELQNRVAYALVRLENMVGTSTRAAFTAVRWVAPFVPLALALANTITSRHGIDISYTTTSCDSGCPLFKPDGSIAPADPNAVYTSHTFSLDARYVIDAAAAAIATVGTALNIRSRRQ